MYTIQQAAHEVLKQANSSLKSVEIARRILEKKLIESTAKNPVQSISQALERNIRMNKGNTPALQFVETVYGREIDIVQKELPQSPTLQPNTAIAVPVRKPVVQEELTVSLSKGLLDKVRIYQLGNGLATLDEAVECLLRTGLASKSTELLAVIKKEMEEL